MHVADPGKKNAAEAAIGEKLGKRKCGDNLQANRSRHFTRPAVSRSLVGGGKNASRTLGGDIERGFSKHVRNGSEGRRI